jgi:hypothetical protein
MRPNILRMHLLALSATLVVACDRTSPVTAPAAASTSCRPTMVVSPGAAELKLSPVPPRKTSAEEDALIAQAMALYPGDGGRSLCLSLMDPRVGAIWTSNNPRAQAIFDRIAAIRKTRADSAQAAQRAIEAANPMRQATIVVIERLSDSAASTIIVRRTNLVPHDVIELPASAATVGAFGGAVHALGLARARSGDDPTRDETVVVRDTVMPASWHENNFIELAQAQLAGILASAPRQVAGIGLVRATEMFVRRHVSPAKP